MKTIPTILAILAAISTSHGATIISFNGNDSATSSLPFGNLTASWSSGIYSVPFSPSNTVFTGNSVSGAPPLVGGVYATNTSITTGPAAYLYRNAVSPDQFRIGWARDDGLTNTSFRYLLMAPAYGWLDLMEGARFDAASSLAFSTVTTNQTSIGSINFVILDSGTYFISSARISATMSTLQITDPNNSLWTSFDPTVTNFQGINPTTLTGATHTFNHVQGVGIFIQGTSVWGGTADGTISLNNWVVNATAIPEPSVVWLLSLCALLCVIKYTRTSSCS